MSTENVRVAYIMLKDVGYTAVREIHRILAAFPGEYSVHIAGLDDVVAEDKFFPLYINDPTKDGPGDLVGRGKIVDVYDTANLELEIYDAQVVKKLREFDIFQMSMQNVELKRKEEHVQDS